MTELKKCIETVACPGVGVFTEPYGIEPSPVSNVTVIADRGQLKVRWQYSQKVGCNLTHYDIRCDKRKAAVGVPCSENVLTNKCAAIGHPHVLTWKWCTIQICAVNRTGAGPSIKMPHLLLPVLISFEPLAT